MQCSKAMDAKCCEIKHKMYWNKAYHNTTAKECASLCDIGFPGGVWLLWTPVAMATAHYSKDILFQMVHFLVLPVGWQNLEPHRKHGSLQTDRQLKCKVTHRLHCNCAQEYMRGSFSCVLAAYWANSPLFLLYSLFLSVSFSSTTFKV